MITLLKPNVVRKLSYDLKLMGQCAVQVIYSKDRKSIAQVEHMPLETLRAEKAVKERLRPIIILKIGLILKTQILLSVFRLLVFLMSLLK